MSGVLKNRGFNVLGFCFYESEKTAPAPFPPPPFHRRKHERDGDTIFAFFHPELHPSTRCLYERIFNVRQPEMNGVFVSIFSCRSCVYPFREAFEELHFVTSSVFVFRVTAKVVLPYFERLILARTLLSFGVYK